MKKIFTFIVILMTLTACATPQIQPVPESATADIPQVNMPNPASVYCTQQGNKLEIHTAADGSQRRAGLVWVCRLDYIHRIDNAGSLMD